MKDHPSSKTTICVNHGVVSEEGDYCTIIGTLEKIEGFVSSKVYCRSCMLYACAKLSQGSRVLVLIFVNKSFVIRKSLTKITKIFLLEIFQLYGILDAEFPIII